ncbi:vesicle-fusing ATPase [Hydrogenispora ethanolica]|uniref:Vesicle-fusing ATPase n=1 Tax=Hydrogenispora ethanolica TaxID=1082276 RepID=A0A4R1SBW5_HYDET|nr:AAA family ATPase [Hydrogenispora ethanolica]TCL76784.1 vesicle-fusing ATPase [Hydrogenispora ethanolica]
MKHWEWPAGCGLGILVYLIWRGVDLTPLLAIGGALLLLFMLTQGRFRSLETLGGQNLSRSESGIGFDDIGGQEVAKRELLEALDFVCDVNRTKALGIRPLKGILLTGPPGTGKTLLAKAASSYTDSVFVAASGSEFIEMYAGVGAQRVRQLFTKARQLAARAGKQSAIIFVDEIEVIAGQRGSHSSHLEYDQTLNQLLVEMDGLKPNEAVKILVIAATNRADLLDPAILRPGRFDRQVKVDLPDREGRLHILKIHAKDKPLADEVSLEEIAKDTFGFSGAHLESLVNEAAILAFRKERTAIGMEEFRESIDKVMMGEKLERRPQPDELRRVAVHETGHAMVSELLRPESVATLTVIPRGKALGFMRQTQTEEQYLYTREYLEDQIAICLGGAMAEELVYGNWSTGSANDFEQATAIARQMLKTGLTRLGIIHEELAGREQMHEVVTEIMEAQKVRVRELLQRKESFFREVIDDLLEREKVSGEWFRERLQCA